ncbi:MAG TPA: carboxypeptidase-like regulatory domain-containing protein, partial [Chitinophagaceae bacterium]|nr:carboxypeptidase-like regulatory domain-containing protein [Chitinophagaceae bacterium]
MRYLLLACLAMLLLALSFRKPASFTVKGKVTDAKGMAIAGVTIREKGTNAVTSSADNGEFSLLLLSEKARLVFSAVGFDQKEVAVKGRAQIEVILKESSLALNEVVVMGYAPKSKKDMTGSIGIVAPPPNIMASPVYDQALTGRAPGLQVTRNHQPRKEEEKRYVTGDTADEEFNTEDYDAIVENRFLSVSEN